MNRARKPFLESTSDLSPSKAPRRARRARRATACNVLLGTVTLAFHCQPATPAIDGSLDAASSVDVVSIPPDEGSGLDVPAVRDVGREDQQNPRDLVQQDLVDARMAQDVSEDVLDGPSPGCRTLSTEVGLQTGLSLTVAGTARSYTLFVPNPLEAGRAYSLVLAFHGDGGTGAGLRTGLNIETAAQGAAIFVYPDARAPARSWDLESALDSNADIAFVQALIASLENRYCIEPRRVFATGHSRGGFFTNVLNCRLGSTIFRAVGPSAGSLYSALPDGYTNEGFVRCEAAPASVLGIHGQADTTVTVRDGRYARDQWVWAHGCSSTTQSVDPSPCVEYTGCAPGETVRWCEIPNQGHALWSAAGTTLWNFFDTRPQ